MALTTNLAREQYNADGSTKKFYFHFAVWQTSQIKVYIGTNQAETEVTSGIDITLTGASSPGEMATGGYVVFSTAPESGKKIAICRYMPFIQEDVYTSGSRFDAHEIEDRLDIDCAERQQLWDGVKRSLKVPGTSSLTPEDFSAELIAASQVAIQKAGEAAASAASAAGSASSANASKNAAASSASAASSSASTAAGSASSAAGSANNAANSANNSAASAVSSANSAAASETSKEQSCECADDSRKWAIGSVAERPEGSAKYWAEKAESIMGDHPSLVRWIKTTIPGVREYALENPNPPTNNVEKYLVFYGTDLLNTSDYSFDVVSTPRKIILNEPPEESLTLTVMYTSEAMTQKDVMPIGSIFGVIGCTGSYVPSGSLPCDGDEKSKVQFPDLYSYMTSSTPFLKTCTYAEYDAEVSATGSCAKWGLNTATEKFRVPKIQDGAFLQQGAMNSELGKTYEGAYVYSLENGKTRSVAVKYFVQVSSSSINQSTMDWSAWASAMSGKMNKSGDTMTGALTIVDSTSGLVVNPSTNTFTWKGNPVATTVGSYVEKSGDTMTGALSFSGTTYTETIKRDNSNYYLRICGGTDNTNGASITLYGGGNTGKFSIAAATSSGDTKILEGSSDGTLKWQGANIITSQGGSVHGVIDGTLTVNSVMRASAPAAGDNSNRIPTTAWCNNAYLKLSGGTLTGDLIFTNGKKISDYLALTGGVLTGETKMPTPALNKNDTTLATTEWVRDVIEQMLEELHVVRAKD